MNEEQYICVCGKSFQTKKSLGHHKTHCKCFQQQKKEKQLEQLKARQLPNGMFKCENCEKEHDGSYGSGRFCSKHCRMIWIGKTSTQKRIKNKTFVSGFQLSNKKLGKAHSPYGTWKCEQCNLIFETRAKMYEHKHQFHPIPNGQVWNKGLTNLPHLSKETKDKIVSSYKKCKSSNCGTYKGFRFERSYELAWIVWNLEHNIKFKRCSKSFEYFDTKQQKLRRYYPDFELADGTIIEIKGYVSQNALDKANAMKQYKVKYQMLTFNEIKKCIEYCINKYGNNFLKVLKDT